MQANKLKHRELYLSRLIELQDTGLVKVLTGIRRCGKSCLMKLMAEHIRNSGPPNSRVLEMNFEDNEFLRMSADKLYEYVKCRVPEKGRLYVFLDEVQNVANWQSIAAALQTGFDCDIFTASSNSAILPTELADSLSDLFVEIKVFPLSFREYVEFNGCRVCDFTLPRGETVKRLVTASGESCDVNEMYNRYSSFGGMPSLACTALDIEQVNWNLEGLYSTVVIRDILERSRMDEQRPVSDPLLLRRLTAFLAGNIGNNISATFVGNTLKKEWLSDKEKHSGKPATKTIQRYIEAVTEAHIFDEVQRFDIKCKEYLKTLCKYYIVDTGLRNYLLGFHEDNSEQVLENIVYFELLRRGYSVCVGKIGKMEVDFIASRPDRKVYIQTVGTISPPAASERELRPLRAIRDNFEKLVIVLEQGISGMTEDGIRIVQAPDFLLGE